MQKDVASKKTPENKKQKSGEKVNKVVLVQAAVCGFLILLIFIAGKLSPATFEFLKKEYREIMSVNMSANDFLHSAKGVMNTTVQNKENEDEQNGKGGEDYEKSDSAVAVMGSLGTNENIITPVHGKITSPYGYRTNPISGKYGLHTGVDIAAKEGTSIVAAYNGVIKETGYGEKKGNFVLMEHPDGTETLYCHCSEILVTEGSVIRAGEAIALIGNTGWSTGPHLHFEIHINGSAVDPLDYLEEDDGRI